MQQIGMKYCYSYEEHNKRSLFFRKRWLGIGLYARGKHKAEYAKMQVFFPNAEQNNRSPSWISFGISKMDDRQDQASLSRRRKIVPPPPPLHSGRHVAPPFPDHSQQSANAPFAAAFPTFPAIRAVHTLSFVGM